MRTKNITVKYTKQTKVAIDNLNFYHDSPHWHFLLARWIEEAERGDIIELTECFDYIYDDIEREKEVDALIKEMESMGLSFYRVVTETKYYN